MEDKWDSWPNRKFMDYYRASLRRSRRVMIVSFIIGGLIMLCGIANLIRVLIQ